MASSSSSLQPKVSQNKKTPAINLLDGIESDASLEGLDWQCLVAFELANSLLLLARDMTIPYNQLVMHYMSWGIITDVVGVVCLPPKQRYWFVLFRLLSSLAMAYATIALWVYGLDGDLSMWRFVISMLRFLHSAYLLVKYKINLDYMWNWPSAMYQIWESSAFASTKLYVYAAVLPAMADVVMPHLLYLSHYNFGEPRLDAICTGLQANLAIGINLKKLVFCSLTDSPYQRMMSAWFIFVAFAVQWIFMWDVFAKAPIPYVHCLAEIVFLLDAILLTREWRTTSNRNKAKDSNHGQYDTVSTTNAGTTEMS